MSVLSANKARGVDRTPWLSRCFVEYFAPGQFLYDRSHLVDVKWRGDRYYCVMLFRVEDDYYLADVAGTHEGRYEVCNDSESTDLETWRTVRVDPWCDGFTTAKERD